jgi:hypothetical protein
MKYVTVFWFLELLKFSFQRLARGQHLGTCSNCPPAIVAETVTLRLA